MTLAERIRKVRQRKGWSQNQLAIAAGIPQPTICRLENGLIKNPTTSLLQRVATVLGVSMDYLLRQDDDNISFDEMLREDPLGQAVFRGYEGLSKKGREQLSSFVSWLIEEEKKRKEK